MSTIGALVLAAGMSRRFGGDKRAARLPSGATVAAETLHQLSAAFDAIHVVLRDNDSDALIESLTIAAPNVRFSRCQDAHLGWATHSLTVLRRLPSGMVLRCVWQICPSFKLEPTASSLTLSRRKRE